MKNFTRPIILVTLFLGAYACSFSQQLKISYDFITNKTTYSRSGIVIKDKEGKPFTENNQPKIKKRDSISVEVRNLNPFVYGCTISMQDSSVLHLNALPTSILSGLTPLPSVLKLLSFGGQFDLKSCLPGGESRGNLAAGGRAEGRELSARDRWIVEQVGPTLRERGLVFVGLDVIGDYLTEVNVTSPTCVQELDKQFGLNISAVLLDHLQSMVGWRS